MLGRASIATLITIVVGYYMADRSRTGSAWTRTTKPFPIITSVMDLAGRRLCSSSLCQYRE